MPVIPCHDNPLQDEQQLQEVLHSYQVKSHSTSASQIVRISQEIPPVDLLCLLKSHQQQPYFYLENRQQAILALGQTRYFCPRGFSQAQQAITHWQRQGAAGPFFCSFAFFADSPGYVVLPRWQIQGGGNHWQLILNLDTEDLSQPHSLIQEAAQFLNSSAEIAPSLAHQVGQTSFGGEEIFLAGVEAALDLIETQQLHKVVLARSIAIDYDHPLSVAQTLVNLRHQHPDCHIFAVSDGRGSSFVGASPERLLSCHQGTLLVDALAGSAPRGTGLAGDTILGDRLLANSKERREHQAVVDFIYQTLGQLALKPQSSRLPRLLKLANIQHLWTPITASLDWPLPPLEVLSCLHPTPAVAGWPKQTAYEVIHRYEQFDRGPYAAPLGWLDAKGNCEFIVGIRSCQIQANRARLYAGAGIVAGSKPQKELAEVQLKFQPLLQALAETT